MSELCMQQSVVYSVVPRAADVDGPLNTVCQYQVRRQEMKWAMFCIKLKMEGLFFSKKWTFPQHRVHICTVSVFFILHFTYLGGCVRTLRTPHAYGPEYSY